MKENKKTKSQKLAPTDWIIYSLLTLWGIAIFYPFYNTVIVSIASQKDYLTTPFMIFPSQIDWSSYQYVLSSPQILWGYRTTLIVTVLGTCFSMFINTSAAYAVTQKFPGKRIISIIILITMFFGGGLIPTYLLMKDLGLMNSYFSMILPVGASAFTIIVMRNYFNSIPASLSESASIDGANDIVIFSRIMLPLALPMLATFALFDAVGRWNEWFNGMLYIKDMDKRPLQLVLRSMLMNLNNEIMENIPIELKEKMFNQGIKMATVVIVMAPIMFVYPFVQRFFMKGIMIGAVKS